MKVLVAYASRTGFTRGIAEFIGTKLGEAGIQAEVRDVGSVRELAAYDAFVVGSAVYMGRWLKEARNFVSKNRAILGSRPLWVFSSGPVGSSRVDAKGRDVVEASKPSEYVEFQTMVSPREHHIFFGGLDGTKLTGATGFMYRMAMKSEAVRASMPEGDFRDWKEIEAWTQTIVGSLPVVA